MCTRLIHGHTPPIGVRAITHTWLDKPLSKRLLTKQKQENRKNTKRTLFSSEKTGHALISCTILPSKSVVMSKWRWFPTRFGSLSCNKYLCSLAYLVQVESLDMTIGLVPVLGKEGGQHQGVLDGHAGPLPVVGRRGVASVAQEGDVAAAPPGGTQAPANDAAGHGRRRKTARRLGMLKSVR